MQVAAVQVLQPYDRGALIQRLLEQGTHRLALRRIVRGGQCEHGHSPPVPVDHRDKLRLETVELDGRTVGLPRGDQLELL